MTALEILALTTLVFWIALHLDRSRRWPADLVLPLGEKASEPPRIPGGVVALIPARNEAEVLPRTLPALFGQSVSGLEVVLIDDESSDGTAAVARQLAEEHAAGHRLRILAAGVPPPGWSGKVHAQQVGFRAIRESEDRPEWILLSDADIRHRPDSVHSLWLRAQGKAGDREFDLVSIMARLRAASPWERLIVPAFVYFFQLLYPFRRVRNPRSGVAAAAGGCVLVRRSALERIGGFTAVADEIIDDVALGRAIKKAGGRIWLGLDSGITSERAYAGLAQLWRMISRTAFTQLGCRWSLLFGTLVAMMLLLISPPWVLAMALAERWEGGAFVASAERAGIWAGLAWLLMSASYLPAVRHHRVPAAWALTLPVAGILFALMTASSAIADWRGYGPAWRGRQYQASRRPSAAERRSSGPIDPVVGHPEDE